MWTHDTPTTTGRTGPPGRTGQRWVVPGIAVGAGIAYLVAGLVGGNAEFGLFGLGVMVATAAALLLSGRRSETVAGLLDRRDERINQIDSTASLVAGMTVLGAVLVMFLVELAQGEDGSPYYQLAALGGLSYLVSVVYLRLRR